jgi:hypothetical protein
MKDSMDADENIRKLLELDRNLKRLNQEEKTIDSRVSFDYTISPTPRIDSAGNRWYKVKLFITPKPGYDLHNIEKVVYVLHPTFNPPKVARSNPDNQFALEFESWGSFHAMAIIKIKNSNDVLQLIQYLPIGQL